MNQTTKRTDDDKGGRAHNSGSAANPGPAPYKTQIRPDKVDGSDYLVTCRWCQYKALASWTSQLKIQFARRSITITICNACKEKLWNK